MMVRQFWKQEEIVNGVVEDELSKGRRVGEFERKVEQKIMEELLCHLPYLPTLLPLPRFEARKVGALEVMLEVERASVY